MIRPFAQLAKRHRREIAVIGALALHGVVIWLLILPSSSRLAGLDRSLYGAMQDGVDVDLMSPVYSEPRPPAAPMSAFQQMTEPPPPDSLQPLDAPRPMASLADIFGKAAPPPSQPATAPSARDAHVAIDTRDNKAANDLWKAIEPCWKRLADPSTLGVTLSVSFSPLGNLAKPPVILRDPAASVSDQRLRSENLAITALAQCGPYLMAFGQSDVKIDFPGKA